jgi:hypothetical protein
MTNIFKVFTRGLYLRSQIEYKFHFSRHRTFSGLNQRRVCLVFEETYSCRWIYNWKEIYNWGDVLRWYWVRTGKNSVWNNLCWGSLSPLAVFSLSLLLACSVGVCSSSSWKKMNIYLLNQFYLDSWFNCLFTILRNLQIRRMGLYTLIWVWTPRDNTHLIYLLIFSQAKY